MNDFKSVDILRDRPVFICGHPKAGTSLLRGILDSHPQLIVFPEETVFFRRFLPRARAKSLDQQLDIADETLIHIFTWNRDQPVAGQEDFPGRDYSTIPFDAVHQTMRQLIANTGYRHAGDILSSAILAFGKVTGQFLSNTQYWVEKSPYNELFTAQIFQWWPEARCIHVVRDPRDNFASYSRKHPNWTAEYFAQNWKRSTRAGFTNREKYGTNRYWLVRYEDLVQSPKENLEQIINFLNISWDPTLTLPMRAGESWQGNSMFSDQFKQISTTPLGRWKVSLTCKEVALIELMTQPFFENFWTYPALSPVE